MISPSRCPGGYRTANLGRRRPDRSVRRRGRVGETKETTMIRLRVASVLVVGLSFIPGARAQFDFGPERPRPSAEAVAVSKAIFEEIDKNSELMANLEYLCD